MDGLSARLEQKVGIDGRIVHSPFVAFGPIPPNQRHPKRSARLFARSGRFSGAPRPSVGSGSRSPRASTSLDLSAAQLADHFQDAPEQVARHGHFGHLEDRVSGVGDDLRSDLDHLLSQ